MIPKINLHTLKFFKLSNSNRLLHKLHLKTGCIIMLFRNLTASQGLCNETSLIVTKLQRNIIEAKANDSDNGHFFSGCLRFHGTATSLLNINVSSSLWGWHFAWQSTILKGKLLKIICLMLPNPVFSHGQFHDSLARVRSF